MNRRPRKPAYSDWRAVLRNSGVDPAGFGPRDKFRVRSLITKTIGDVTLRAGEEAVVYIWTSGRLKLRALCNNSPTFADHALPGKHFDWIR